MGVPGAGIEPARAQGLGDYSCEFSGGFKVNGTGGRTRTDMDRFTEDWKDADPDIPELIEARERLAELKQ